MGAGGWVSPRRSEVVYESERTRVTRLFYPGRTLIRKEPLGPDAERRLEHETAVLAGLRGAAGLAQLADAPRYPGSVLLVDAGRVNLARLARPLAADGLVWLALRLARALANLHDRAVIHRDITPANVVLSDDDGDPCLVGFGRATSFRAAELTGTTGRTGPAVDRRADLYGLGATLYELAAGQPPYHRARRPAPPAEVVAGLPAPLSAIIMRLLEQDPDDRYQSASGVVYDLLLLENRLIRGAFTAARLENRRITDEQSALRRVATLVAPGARPQEVFIAVAEETGRLLEADFSVLIRYDRPTGTLEIAGSWLRADAERPAPAGRRLPLGGYNVSSLVYETGRPARIDYQRDDVSGTVAAGLGGFRSSVGAPVIIGSRPWGALVVARSREQVLPAETEARLAAFNELVGTAIANAEASAEVAASRARVIAAADQARRRIERDLHDGAQQRLVSLALQLRQAQAAVPPGLADLSTELDRALTAATSALDEVGQIARGVHPAILTSGGLRPAVRALAHRSPVPTRLEECADGRLPEQVEVTAYYVIAEALTNATKHARAEAVIIRAEVAGEALIVTIRDGGVGGADPGRGTGLTGLKDRVEALGGVMRINSPPGAGTLLRVELPLTADGGAAHDDRYAQ